MGQKTHPLGFRLGITKKHNSTWYTKLNNYATLLKEDDLIRTHISTISKTSHISSIQINRLRNITQIIIDTARPEEFFDETNPHLQLNNLLQQIKGYLSSAKQVSIKIIEVKRGDLRASFIADFIVAKLEDRVAFRQAMREALKIAQDCKVTGIKIQVSGRLNGAEIARSEWIREGRVPLQTLKANIDYSTKEANTIYGILGIKVWIFNKNDF